MRLHRFYIEPTTPLKQDFWLHEPALLAQWQKVLRFRPGQEVVLFDGIEHERLYKITELKPNEAHLEHVTDFVRQVPAKEITLLWALLKKDKNDWVLQKCTELGVRHFVPLLAERSEKIGFNLERARKIVIEAAEQCGRGDIPSVREPLTVATAIDDYQPKLQLLVCDKSKAKEEPEINNPAGVLIGPEGGWSDAENTLFSTAGLALLDLHDFTLRAETACVVAITKLLQ